MIFLPLILVSGCAIMIAWRYIGERPGLTAPVALRYLLMCMAFFLLALLETQNPLVKPWWGQTMLGLSLLFSWALVIVVGYYVKTDAAPPANP